MIEKKQENSWHQIESKLIEFPLSKSKYAVFKVLLVKVTIQPTKQIPLAQNKERCKN